MLKKVLLMAAVVLCGTEQSFGDVIFNETFTYADGTPPSPWAVTSGTGGQLISGNTLVMTPSSTAGSNQSSSTGTADYLRSFTTVTTGTVFAGYDLRITSAPTNSGDNYFSHFASGSAHTSRVFLNLISLNTNIGLSEASAAAVSTSPTPLALNTTLRVVQSYDLATGTASLWLNPLTDLDLALLTDATGGNATSITGFAFRIDNGTDGAKIIDNLIVATTFAEAANITAVPEPSSIALVSLIGCTGLVAAYRRRKAKSMVA